MYKEIKEEYSSVYDDNRIIRRLRMEAQNIHEEIVGKEEREREEIIGERCRELIREWERREDRIGEKRGFCVQYVELYVRMMMMEERKEIRIYIKNLEEYIV
jgi:hypothetical protein